jgi:hypothetical protein
VQLDRPAQPEADDLAALDAMRRQRCGDTVRPVVELPVAKSARIPEQGDRALACLALDRVGENAVQSLVSSEVGLNRPLEDPPDVIPGVVLHFDHMMCAGTPSRFRYVPIEQLRFMAGGSGGVADVSPRQRSRSP